MKKDEELPLGTYEHYKGAHYEVIGVASHSETLEKFVVYYRHRYSSVLQKTAIPDEGDNTLWIRPLAMFTEMVKVKGKKVPRFKKVD